MKETLVRRTADIVATIGSTNALPYELSTPCRSTVTPPSPTIPYIRLCKLERAKGQSGKALKAASKLFDKLLMAKYRPIVYAVQRPMSK